MENPVNNQIILLNLKKFLCIRPAEFLKKINREILLFPSISREMFLRYYGTVFLEVLIFEKKHTVLKKELKKKVFPIMVNSNRCNLRLKYYNKRKYFRDEVDFEGGYFIYNGTEKVVRSTLSIRHNYFFFLNQDPDQYHSDKILIFRKLKENKEISILKSFFLSTNTIIVTLKIKQEEIMILIDVFLDFFKLNLYDPLMIQLYKEKKNMLSCYDESIYKKIARNFLTNHLLIKDSLKTFSRRECLKFLGFCLTDITNNRFWSEKETIGFKIIKKKFLDKIIILKDNYFFIINVINNLISNKIEKNNIDNLDLFNNMEIILSGDLCCSVMISSINEACVQVINDYNVLIEDDNINFLCDIYDECMKKYINLNKIFRKIKTLISIGSILMFLNYEPKDFGNSVVLQRFNKISFLSDLDLVHRGMYFRKQTTLTPRKIFLESFGFICPVNTPDGVLCGLLNHFCIGTKVTPLQCFNIVDFNLFKKETLLCINIIKINIIFIMEYHKKYISFVKNNIALGLVNKSCQNIIIHYFYKLRGIKIRQNINNPSSILFFVSINRKFIYDEIFIYSSNWKSVNLIYSCDQSNRILRLLKQKNNCSFQLIGCLEQLHIKINWLLFKNIKKNDSTYCHEDVASGSLLSFTASLFPYTHHNQSTRNIYQCKMSKQAIGYQNNAYIFRRDSKLQFLISNQLPLINTENMMMYGLESYPFGTNTLISICSNTGLDMEDACVFKKSSRDLGLFHSIINNNQITANKLEENLNIIKISFINLLNLFEENNLFDNSDIGKLLLNDNKNLFNMLIKNLNLDHSISSSSRIYKKEYNTFDYRYEYNNFFVINCSQKVNVKVSKYIKIVFRKPNVGDKLSSRHGQKNVISILYKNEDLPFNQIQGVVPDIILNPHSFPSRMTIGMLKEIILARSCALVGKISIVKSNTARDYGLNCIKENSLYLKSENNKKSGYDKMIDGKNGETIINQVFSGIVFYQKMKQMVKDKAQYRVLGKNDALTKQPIGGRVYGGAIRLGEMEKDGLIAHGVSSIILDRFLFSSDFSIMGYCIECEKIIDLRLLEELDVKNENPLQLYSVSEINNIISKTHNCSSKKVIFIEIPHVLFYLLTELFSFSLTPVMFQF